ncbi:sporulation protein Cse60 [Paenibacillus lautus]|uniref:sporulation protein Cse60 n=1 Tax=Paenibacillus lautus TaxID=1401 RepID=UPI002DB65657|nr:sporulation protein Cse60 [Paenibacillus lautus]MEC0204173.1 sporulation protein Cse60 [Paenibacillus lautus]
MLKTLKVELFSDSNLDDLQDQVNEFLYNIHPDDVKDIKLSSADGTHDILVIYKE